MGAEVVTGVGRKGFRVRGRGMGEREGVGVRVGEWGKGKGLGLGTTRLFVGWCPPFPLDLV